MIRFPCIAFRESRIILSREEMQDKMEEARLIGKSCEIGIYAFAEWLNTDPVDESAVIDKIILKGEKSRLEMIAEEKLKKGIGSTLIYDGLHYLLFVFEELDSVEELNLRKEEGVEVIKNVRYKFTVPTFENLRTGKKSLILRKWKVNG